MPHSSRSAADRSHEPANANACTFSLVCIHLRWARRWVFNTTSDRFFFSPHRRNLFRFFPVPVSLWISFLRVSWHMQYAMAPVSRTVSLPATSALLLFPRLPVPSTCVVPPPERLRFDLVRVLYFVSVSVRSLRFDTALGHLCFTSSWAGPVPCRVRFPGHSLPCAMPHGSLGGRLFTRTVCPQPGQLVAFHPVLPCPTFYRVIPPCICKFRTSWYTFRSVDRHRLGWYSSGFSVRHVILDEPCSAQTGLLWNVLFVLFSKGASFLVSSPPLFRRGAM